MEVQRKRQETYCNTFAMVIIYKKMMTAVTREPQLSRLVSIRILR